MLAHAPNLTETPTRYLGSLRVYEAAQPEREALRQQVAKFSA